MKCQKFAILASLFCLASFSMANASNSCDASDSLLNFVSRIDGNYQSDYVVVGVGTAGAVVTKFLSDDLYTSVVALHIGENLTKDPLIKYSKNAFLTVPSAVLGPPFFENGLTVPQTHANNRNILWAMALPEGGASSVNAGAFVRGTNQLYAKWEAIAGPLWSVKRILDTYKDLEHYHGETTNPRAHGYSGPISVLQVLHPSTASRKFTKAAINATGLPFVLDYNDPKTPIGISSQFQYTQKGEDGAIRVSSAVAFLNKNVMHPNGVGVDGRNLRVLFNSTALRTIWDGNTAIGVEFLQDGKVRKAFAKKGVVVCAGLQSSPFLLHSGVGPKKLLKSLGIPVIFDNPKVGKGLADQPHIVMTFDINPADVLDELPNGLFANISMLPAPGDDSKVRKVRISTIAPIAPTTLAILDLLQPKSRGSVSIGSADPLDPPIINLGVLKKKEDLLLFKAALQIYVKRINKAIHKIDPLYELTFPNPAILDDDAAVIAFIKQNVGCNQHFQSHCRMAPLKHGGVVDSKGQVYGTKHLFVADNSIVPLCMDGAPMASALLIGANIARIIKEEIKDDD